MDRRTVTGALAWVLGAGMWWTGSALPQEPLAVVAVTPKGQVASLADCRAIVVTFNQPMVPLQELGAVATEGPLSVTPPVAGGYRWLGTTSLAFVPKDSLPYATRFSVRVPAGLTSVSGAPRAQDVLWDFETPRPQLKYVQPEDGATGVDVMEGVVLYFTVPMSPTRAAPFLSWKKTRTGRSVPFTLRHPRAKEVEGDWRVQGDSSTVLILQPQAPLRRGTAYVVQLKEGLPAHQGDLGLLREEKLTFQTYADLRLVELSQKEGHNPQEALAFKFTNPVAPADLARCVHFTPPVDIPAHYAERTYPEQVVHLWLPLLPDTTYQVAIDDTLRDVHGNRLIGPVRMRLTTGPYPSRLIMTGEPGVVEAGGDRRYPMAYVNLTSVRVQLARVVPDSLVPLLLQPELFSSTFTRPANTFLVDRLWKLPGRRNERRLVPIDVDWVLGGSKHGLVFVQVDNLLPGPQREVSKALLQVTELGVTAKFSPHDVLVYVTRLADAAPVAGAKVELRGDDNRLHHTTVTDAKGVATAPGWRRLGLAPQNAWAGPRLWVLVYHGRDVAYTASDWGTGIYPYRFGIDYDWRAEPQRYEGVLFTDRTTYRPGDTVHVKCVLREKVREEWQVPQRLQLLGKVFDSRGESAWEQTLVPNNFGSLAFDYPVAKDAPLGYYRVTVDTVGRQQPQGWYGEPLVAGVFRVEAYRPVESQVSVRPAQAHYIVGDTLRATVVGTYLFGGTMAHQPANWWVRLHPGSFSPPEYEGYFFGVADWMVEEENEPRVRMLSAGQGKLDNAGTLRITTPLSGLSLRATMQVKISADVESASRQHVSSSGTSTLHPGEYYVGIQLASTLRREGQPLKYRIVTLDTEGKAVTAKKLRITVMKRQYHSVRKAGIGGRYEWISKAVTTVIDSAWVVTTAEPQVLSFVPKSAGSYFICAEGRDGRGNTVVTWANFYVSGRQYAAWERREDDILELVPERSSYGPGEVANILVKSPFEEAEALITVERETVLRHFTRHLEGTAPRIEIPIREQDLPNIFVSVILLKGRTANQVFGPEGEDVGRPSFKIGYVGLNVDPGSRHLQVEVTTERSTYRPGEQATVTVRLRDATGSPIAGEVTLAVVDAAVLNLTGYRLPDPFSFFYGPRSLSVQTAETRLHVVEQRNYGEKGEDRGGDGGEGRGIAAEALRSRFLLTAHWHPSLVAGADGQVTVRFPLPDNLTRFVVMAVGQTKDSRFGCGQTEFSVSKELMIQPALPRFARRGDLFEAGAVVHNQTVMAGEVQVTLQVEGVLLKGNGEAQVTIGAGQTQEVRFPVEVRQTGTATFTFSARMGRLRDAVRVTIPLQEQYPKESVATSGRTEGKTQEAIVVPTSALPGTENIEAWVASTAMTELAAGAEYLFTYPYGCLEQRVSAVLPMIVAGDLVRAFDLSVLRNANIGQIIAQTLGQFRAYELPDGGFSYWPGERHAAPFVSAYAMYALVEARAHGYQIDEQMLKRGLSYLREFLRQKADSSPVAFPERAWLASKALAAYVLARAGQPDHAYIDYLYEQRARLPLMGKALLLRTLSATGSAKERQQVMVDALLSAIRVDPTTAHFEEEDPGDLVWIFHSDVRTTAVALQALLEARGGFALDHKVVQWLMAQRKNGMWRTTQENLHVLLALARYFAIYEKEPADFTAQIQVAGKRLLSEVFAGRELGTRRATLSLEQLPRGRLLPVDVAKSGKGQLYYGLRLNYCPSVTPPSRDEGLAVLKVITPLSPPFAEPLSFAPGALLKVELKVIAPQGRTFVVVDDPLPAGLEAVNVSLQTAAAEAEQMAQLAPDVWRDNWWGSFNHVELHDDRVLVFADYLRAGVHTYTYLARATTVGDFGMPPTVAVQMYEPEVFGRQAGARVRVGRGQ
ncbi:MAG: alpha-2-macroglobulin family protein [Candidatus Oleimicrobiaceae bacterium]